MNQSIRSSRPFARPVLICFSHLRWDFVFQRPQHLMTRAAQTHQVFYIEEPEYSPGPPHFRMRVVEGGVTVLTPVFEHGLDGQQEQKRLVQGLVSTLGDRNFVHWYYTPLARSVAAGLPCDVRVYDCMDELSGFRFAPQDLREQELALMGEADLVFTGGASLFAAKRNLHPLVRCYPSSVDVAHFGTARLDLPDPVDQAQVPFPRIGFFGVIDERMDLNLVAMAAEALPDTQFVMLGPIAKIDEADLPRAQNIHWLGRKSYADLPAYMANWNAGWMPFALNEATAFISPTKTPEFLAAGLPVVSTAVTDVAATYGREGLVTIAGLETTADALLDTLSAATPDWLVRVDAKLATMSWDGTWEAMLSDIQEYLLQPVEV